MREKHLKLTSILIRMSLFEIFLVTQGIPVVSAIRAACGGSRYSQLIAHLLALHVARDDMFLIHVLLETKQRIDIRVLQFEHQCTQTLERLVPSPCLKLL